MTCDADADATPRNANDNDNANANARRTGRRVEWGRRVQTRGRADITSAAAKKQPQTKTNMIITPTKLQDLIVSLSCAAQSLAWLYENH